MADVSKIKLPSGTTYNIKDTVSGYTTNTGTITKVQTTAGAHTTINVSSGAAAFNVPTKTSHLTNDSGFITNAGVTGVKGNAESSYRTGQVNLTAANVGAIPANSNGNTQNLYRPLQLNGCNDNTLDSKINTLRANRLAFLPADQIIIEKTVDGGATWTDAGVADSTKVGLFSETRVGVSVPLLDGSQNINCGLRITFTAMKYNVPANTAETNKYNYWNSEYIVSTERYNQLKEMYFWVLTSNNSMSIKVERATGANSTSWSTIYDSSANNYGLTGWSGNDYIRFTQGVFGGGTTQTGNFWNYRLTFFTRGTNGSTTLNTGYLTSAQSIMEIRGYGDTWWTRGNEYAANDKIYTHDYLQNATFPAKVIATSFSGNLTGNVTGNVSGTASNVTGTVAIANGGTGQTTAANAINALLNGLPTWTADPTDTTYFIRQDTGGSATYGKVKASTIWNYISGKLPTIPTSTNSATTGISIAAHGTGTVIGVQSTTTTASKVTVGSSSTDYGVKSAGSASTWTFEEKTIPNVTSAGTASSWTFEEKTIPNVTAAGSGSASLTFTMDTTDTKKLKITFSHTHTAPTIGTAIKVQSKSGGSNGTAPTLGTAIKVQSKSGGANSTTPTLGSKVPTVSASDVTVPIKNTSASTFVTGTTHTVTDNGHTHTI